MKDAVNFIKDFDFLFLKNDYFTSKKEGSRLRNDIILIEYNNGLRCRIYLNNKQEFVEIPYNNFMLNEISKITWTKDSNSENGMFIKSDADNVNLNTILQRYDENYKYSLYPNEWNITDVQLEKKRLDFLKRNPNANKENPEACYIK